MEIDEPENLTLDRTLPGGAERASRLLLYTVLAVVASVFLWAAFTQIDVIVEARGRLTVEGEPIRLSVPEAGVAAEVLAKVGDHVVAGQALLRLDSFRYDANETRLTAEADAAKADSTRYQLLAESARESRKYAVDEVARAQAMVALYDRIISVGADRNIDPTSAERRTIDRESAKASLSRAREALAKSQSEAVQADRQVDAAEARLRSLTEQLAESRRGRERLTLVAPRDGTVTQVKVLHPGLTVAVDSPAVTLSPDGRQLLASVQIPNESIRRVRTGHVARLQFDAYPTQDFGDVTGQLVRLDPDTDESGQYHAWITPDRGEIQGSSGVEALRPGLTCTAKIIIERRSVLSLVLDPIRRAAKKFGDQKG